MTTSDPAAAGPEPVAGAEQLVAVLEALVEQDERWTVVPSPGVVTLTRGWPDGTVDTVVVLSTDIAYGLREDPAGRHVWSIRGARDFVVGHAGRLPAPDASDAPHTPIGMPGGEWAP